MRKAKAGFIWCLPEEKKEPAIFSSLRTERPYLDRRKELIISFPVSRIFPIRFEMMEAVDR
jgi:hypothetical protein